MEAPRTPTRSGAVSPSKSLAMHHELYAQYDTLIKQIDRQRGEAFTRIHERLNRAQYISQVCSDQVNTLNTKLHNLETKMAEAKNQHISEHVLRVNSPEKLYTDRDISIEQILNDVENNRYDNLESTVLSEDKSTISAQ